MPSSSSAVLTPPSSLDSRPAPAPQVSVDDTQPVTSIQVRLGDGTRMVISTLQKVARFNHTHTVGDLRRFVAR